MTMNEELLREDLLAYIEKEQIAYQFVDELINFTHLSSDHDEAEQIIEAVSKGTLQLHEADDSWTKDSVEGFGELKSWAQDGDLLVLVNDDLLLCLPKQSRIQLKLSA